MAQPRGSGHRCRKREGISGARFRAGAGRHRGGGGRWCPTLLTRGFVLILWGCRWVSDKQRPGGLWRSGAQVAVCGARDGEAFCRGSLCRGRNGSPVAHQVALHSASHQTQPASVMLRDDGICIETISAGIEAPQSWGRGS